MYWITQDWISVLCKGMRMMYCKYFIFFFPERIHICYFLYYASCYALLFFLCVSDKLAAKNGLRIFVKQLWGPKKKRVRTENHTLESATRALLYVTSVCCVAHSSHHFMLSLPNNSLGNHVSVLLRSTTHTTQTKNNKHHPWITLFLLQFSLSSDRKLPFSAFFFFAVVPVFFFSFGRMFRSSINKALITRKKVRRHWVIYILWHKVFNKGIWLPVYLLFSVLLVSIVTCLCICLINCLPVFL